MHRKASPAERVAPQHSKDQSPGRRVPGEASSSSGSLALTTIHWAAMRTAKAAAAERGHRVLIARTLAARRPDQLEHPFELVRRLDAQGLVQRRHQEIHVRVEALVAHRHGVSVRQRPQTRRKAFNGGHFGAIDEHWDSHDAGFKCGRDLFGHEIAALAESRSPRTIRRPARADDCNDGLCGQDG